MRRLWGVRHVRWLYWAWQVNRWYDVWAEVGYVGPNKSDVDYLNAIWRGER